MAQMPQQKPGKSKQDYQTPPALLDAIKQRLRIEEFSIDLAADADNAIVHRYYDEEIDALHPDVPWNVIPGQWAWLNPPYADIFPWVQKAVAESAIGAHIVMLVPAAVGANWWRECVEPFAYTVFLNGRIQFVGAEGPYPKDCALLFYTPWGFKGSEIWRWRDDVPKLQQPELGED